MYVLLIHQEFLRNSDIFGRKWTIYFFIVQGEWSIKFIVILDSDYFLFYLLLFFSFNNIRFQFSTNQCHQLKIFTCYLEIFLHESFFVQKNFIRLICYIIVENVIPFC